MIGQLRSTVIDCPDPRALAAFYAELTGLPLAEGDSDGDEWVVLALGARRLDGEGEGFRVYADPAGHPFCLCWD
ncbi:VOC family protein [Micromonospora haikouensis]|uniref:VOC family protein n=1 Tax=Micromonospora haikouensis TaxID=686309 RepID=UPI00344AD7BE